MSDKYTPRVRPASPQEYIKLEHRVRWLINLIPKLDGNAVKVLLVLAGKYYYRKSGRIHHPPISKLCEVTGLKLRTLHRALADLVELKILYVRTKPTHGRHVEYDVRWPATITHTSNPTPDPQSRMTNLTPDCVKSDMRLGVKPSPHQTNSGPLLESSYRDGPLNRKTVEGEGRTYLTEQQLRASLGDGYYNQIFGRSPAKPSDDDLDAFVNEPVGIFGRAA